VLTRTSVLIGQKRDPLRKGLGAIRACLELRGLRDAAQRFALAAAAVDG
jgi:hypothetical protein